MNSQAKKWVESEVERIRDIRDPCSPSSMLYRWGDEHSLILNQLKMPLGMRIFTFVNFESLIYMKLYNLLILNKIQKCTKTMLRH